MTLLRETSVQLITTYFPSALNVVKRAACAFFNDMSFLHLLKLTQLFTLRETGDEQ